MSDIILETERLLLRQMTQDDYSALCRILKDKDVMYAYEGPFNDQEVQSWLDRQLWRYAEYGFGLWAVVLKSTGTMIGQCGLTMQDYKDTQILEIGYLFRKDYWHKGYASEAANSCKEYAFREMDVQEVYSIIRDTNLASQKVAERNGMRRVDEFIKHYRNVDMPHYLYCVKRNEGSIS